MHKSRLGGVIIDCDTDDLQAATDFWAKALGAPAQRAADLSESSYVRVHIDIESDDIDAEVARLEKLGAQRIEAIEDWVVLEAPTGQRFCVVPVESADFADTANVWNEEE
jgi:predicted enzyme related to lactoylglutathione lyase